MTVVGVEPVVVAKEQSSVKSLQQILSSELQREVDYEEAREIGESLVDFFEVLAQEA